MNTKYKTRTGFALSLLCSLIISACGGGGGGGAPTGNIAPVAVTAWVHAASVVSVTPGTTVTLNGSGSSDANGDTLTYAWSFTSKPAGSTAALSSATPVGPTFIADLAGNYVLSLVVNDGTVNSPASNLTITTTVASSSGSSSGSIGVYTKVGSTFTVAPGGAGAAGSAKLISLPNSGPRVGAITLGITSSLITTSLTTVNGTSVDGLHNVGMAFGYNSSIVSIFSLSTLTEIATYNAGTVGVMNFSGASNVKISGAIMDAARQWIILSTADGYDIIDYSTPTAPVRVRLIPSTLTAVPPVVGVEMLENFAYDIAIPNGGAPFPALMAGGSTGGSTSIGSNLLQIVDASTGKVYTPDVATKAIFTPQASYIDAAAVDAVYHVVLLAEEFSNQQHLIDLNKVIFNTATGTYSLPASGYLVLNATGGNSLGNGMTNISIESNGHYVFAGRGFGGTTMSLALLKDPAIGLGFISATTIPFAMPADTDNLGAAVVWLGARDPHGLGSYQTSAIHPTSPNTSLSLWINWTGSHIAVIDMAGVLAGSTVIGYNPSATVPKDISYFAVP